MKLVPYQRSLFGTDLFRDFFKDDFACVTTEVMKADVKEMEGEYVVEAEMPGVAKEDVTLVCEKGVLTITAKRGEEKTEEQDGYIRRERYSGVSKRSFALKDIKEEEISAKLEDGVLIVKLPKMEEAQTKKTIEIE